MANNWAIVVGINHYEYHPQRQLNYAVADAQLIHQFLCTQADFDPKHIFLCLGDEANRASDIYPRGGKLLSLLTRELHPDRTGKIDRLWFYFGGHGVSRNGRDYLLTADSLVEDSELRFALPIDEVIAALRKHQTADIVLILDSCRQLQGSRGLVDASGKQTIELARDRGITTIFSCEYGQYSYELASLKQGAFTYALVEGLKQHTLPDKLEQYLQRRVAELNQRRDQVPRIRVEPASKVLQPLLPSAVTAEDIQVLIDRAREAELEEEFETAKRLWWEVIEVAQAGDRIREARSAIERIDRKMDRSQNNTSPAIPTHSENKVEPPQVVQYPPSDLQQPQPQPDYHIPGAVRTNISENGTPSKPKSTQPHQSSRFESLTRQQFLRWIILGGIGIVGMTIASQFLDRLSRPIPAPPNFSSGSTPSPFEDQASGPSTQDYQARVTQPIGLIIYQEPRSNAAKIGGVEFNREVTVLEDNADGSWQKIRSGSVEGWVKGGNMTRLNQDYQARVTQPIGLIIYQEPRGNAAQLGGVEFNRKVTVLEDNADGSWQKIRSGSVEGWVKGGNMTRLN